MTWLSAKAWGYIAAALAVVAVLFKTFRAGKEAARVEGLEEQVKNAETRSKVDDAVALADNAERKRLRGKWTKGQGWVRVD